MRTIAALSLFAAIGTVVVVSAADNTPAKPISPKIAPTIARPVPTIAPTLVPTLRLPPSIANVRRSPATASAPYSSGAVAYEVEVVNPANNPTLETGLVVDRVVGGARTRVTRVPVRVPAGSRQWIPVSDTSGIESGCVASYRAFSLESPNASKTVRITPTCTFSMRGVDPNASLPPDRKLAQREGRLWYHTVETPDAPRCGIVEEREYQARVFRVNVTVRNSAPSAATGIRLRYDDAPGSNSGALFNLGPGQERRVEVSSGGFDGDQRRYVLRIEGGGVPVFQPSWYADVTRSCRLDVDVL